MCISHRYRPWYSTVEIKRESFHQNEHLFVVENVNFFKQCQPSKGENDTASDVYDYLSENKHD